MSKESAYFLINELSGKHDEKILKKQFDTIPGIISVSVNVVNGRVAVDYDNTGVKLNEIEERLNELGYNASKIEDEKHIM